jgi:flagellar protein FlbD
MALVAAEPRQNALDFRQEALDMIQLTRLNGQLFVLNAEKIRYVESTPDTLVCCDTGDKLMVRETLQEVMRRAIDYARVIRKPVTE